MDYSCYKPGSVALYLDDCRTPSPNFYWNWVIVRNAKEFKHYILQQGMPDFVSFDHDLCDAHKGSPETYLDPEYWLHYDFEEETGYDAAKWLVQYCLENDVLLPHFTVHSANPAGAENILSLLNNFRKAQGQEPTGYRTHW